MCYNDGNLQSIRYRSYVSSKIYREIKLRSGIIHENQLILLPQEKVHSSVQDVWNLSIEQVFIINSLKTLMKKSSYNIIFNNIFKFFQLF